MGEVVVAAAVVHAPQLLTRPAYEELDKLAASADALEQIGELLDPAAPDALLVIGTDHLEAFWLEAVPSFLLYVGEEAHARFTTHSASVPVHTELAIALLKGCIEAGFDLAYSMEATLGHAFLTPFQYVRGARAVPVIPLLVNVYLPPLPSPRRCYELGRAIRATIDARPERVAVIASGGMSHFPGTERYYEPDFAFDDWVIQEIEAGRWDDLLDLTPVQLDEVGEGELLTWFVLLGIMGKIPGSVRSYQATSHHGQGVVQFLPAPEPRPPSDDEVPRYGGHEFTFTDYQYYRFPVGSTFALNKFLHGLISDAEQRRRFIDDQDAVLASSGLRDDEITAFDSSTFTALVEAGAHPLMALSAWQVLANDRIRIDAEQKTGNP